jgi:hypothetical protein
MSILLLSCFHLTASKDVEPANYLNYVKLQVYTLEIIWKFYLKEALITD